MSVLGWIVIVCLVIAVMIIIEGIIIAPDKMPFNKRREKNGKR